MSQKVILENKSIENINLSQVQNADTLDGYHADNIYKASTFSIGNYSSTQNFKLIATITIPGPTSNLRIAGFTVLFTNRECLDGTSFILTLGIRRWDSTGVTFYYKRLGPNKPRDIFIRSNDGITFYVYFTSHLNSYTTYYWVTPLCSEGNIVWSNTSLTASELIAGSVVNVTATEVGETGARVISSYKDGTTWYRLYSDGWVEQGGVTTVNECQPKTITLPVKMSDTNYFVVANQINQSTNGDCEMGVGIRPASTTQVVAFTHYINPNSMTICWEAKGYSG